MNDRSQSVSVIDISILSGDWQKYANQADSAENGKKIGFLDSVFEKQEVIRLARDGGKTEEEIRAFFQSQGAESEFDSLLKIQHENEKNFGNSGGHSFDRFVGRDGLRTGGRT